MYKLGFIGAGNMAGAIYDGVVKNGLYKPSEIALCDNNPAKRDKYVPLGSGFFDVAAELAGKCEIVFLSIKPQTFPTVLPTLKGAITEKTLLISIAAGITVDFIKAALEFDAKVVRVMPNTCLMSGAGATAMTKEAPVSDEDFAKAKQIFECAGTTAVIPADKMNEVIPVNGSSPAYILRFAKIFCEEAEKSGIAYDTAGALFAQTLIGTANLMLHSGKDYQTLIDMVTSPGGTTFAGLCALDDGGFDDALRACFDATVKRSIELGKA